MRVGSLFAGIGGFDVAARWIGWETRWVSEIDPYASSILAKRFPHAPNLGDITKITNPPPVDVLCGGFPCQDISVAGKGAGITGERSGLWKEYARIIGEVLPLFVIIENSPRLRQLGLGIVLQDLMALGYDAEWHCIPASSVGAPHQRDRIWILAYPKRTGLERHTWHGPILSEQRWLCEKQDGPISQEGLPPREHQEWWWTVEPNVGRVAHGVPSRVDRLKCLGNAIVPQVAYRIFRAIQATTQR